MSVQQISPHLTQLDAPKFLRDLPGWLIWRVEHNDRNAAKPLKVPYYANGTRRYGVQGSLEDREQLVTFLDAKRAAARRGFSGVGFCLMPEFGVVAGDFDNCVSKPGQEDQFVHQTVLDLTLGTYAEFSPSDTGVRAFWRSQPCGNGKDPHGEPFGLEVFSTKGFVTFTGRPLWQTEFNGCEDHVAPMPGAMVEYLTNRLGPDSNRATLPTGEASDVLLEYAPKRNVSMSEATEALNHLDPSMPREPWLKVGMALHHEFSGSEEAFVLWDTWSSAGATYGQGVSIERVWKSFGNNTSRTPITWGTVQKMVSERIRSKEGLTPTTEDGEIIDPFRAIPVAEFAAGRLYVEWLVKGILPRSGLAVVYGAPGSGKTFAVLDIAMAVALGHPWRDGGKRTKQAAVVYVVCEGSPGFRTRLNAYAIHHQIDLNDLPLHVINTAPNLLEMDHVLRVVEEINSIGHQVGMVVIDTLSRALHGADENSSTDMGKVISHCDTLYRKTKALVTLVAHSGKDSSRGVRGWSGLKGAADTELEVTQESGGGVRNLFVSKQKDAEAGQKYPFQLKPIPLGKDPDNDEVSSCVVEYIEPEKQEPVPKRFNDLVAGIAHLAELDTEFNVDDLANVVFKARNERRIATTDKGEGYKNPRTEKKRIRETIDEYAKLPNCGIEIVGDQITITDPGKFNL